MIINVKVYKSGKICNKKNVVLKYKIRESNIIHSCKTFLKTLDFKIKRTCFFKKKAIDDYLLQDIANIVLLKLQEI
jgi:hypothetical protein